MTPYDFVKKQIRNEDYNEAEMISKIDQFKNANQLWASLRAIRLQFEKLWKGQLDEIMAIISSGVRVTGRSTKVKNSEPHLKEFRTHFNEQDLLQRIQQMWENADDPSSSNDFIGLVNNEIERRKRENDPRTCKIGAAVNNPQTKKQQVRNFLDTERGFNEENLGKENGVYVFSIDDDVVYVGQTTDQNFKDRIDQHFDCQSIFTENFTKIEFYTVNRRVGIAAQRISEFEKLMIFKHKTSQNEQRRLADSIKIALEIINCEIQELKQTGG